MYSIYDKTFIFLEGFKPNHIGIYFSLILHFLILLFALGLPDFFKPKTIFIPNVIPIEILNVSDITSLTPKNKDIQIDNKQTKQVKQKKFNSSDNTEIQKIDLQEKLKVKNNIKSNQVELNEKEIIKAQNIGQ